MKKIGIVVEYNPFHNGHLYQINKIKEKYKDSLIIVVMSSSFTQRGEISILDKWQKTQVALNNGVDMVIELPYVFASQSADTFSKYAIKTLNEFKIDALAFGCESDNIESLTKCAEVQINNKEFDDLVKKHIDLGNNYPTSLNYAIKKLTNNIVEKPNDLLAVTYIKEILKLNKNIELLPIKRTNDFNDIKSNNKIVSASNIRHKIINNKNIKKHVPTLIYKYLKDFKYNEDKLFSLLKYKILSTDNLSKYVTVDEGIESRIYSSINKSNNLEELIENIKTKRYTYNKIQRMLTHILVDFTKEENNKINDLQYLRILGMNKKAQEYLSTIKKSINYPILTKYKKDFSILEFETKVTSIYSLILDKDLTTDEHTRHTIII